VWCKSCYWSSSWGFISFRWINWSKRFEQARQFTAATEVTSLAVTKLDGTAKGGVVIGISDQFKIPVKYIGVGEGIEDLQVFNKHEFVDSFFK
jgi:fused signal recognition particle receptor